MKIKYIIPLILGSLLCMAGFTSCDDDDDLGQAPRLFSPIVNETTIRSNSIEVHWERYAGTQTYELTLSKDTFKTAPITTVTGVDTTFYIFENLEWDTEYQVGIKGIGSNIESNVGIKTGLKTFDYPTRLINPTSDDIIDNAVRVKWTVTSQIYTSLVVTNTSDEVIKTVGLTPAQYATGEMIINGLNAKTSYRVKAYVGNEYNGKRTYTTLAPQDIPDPKVDLRNMSDEEASDYITTAFIAGLEDNTTVILNGGTVYKINGPTFTSKAVKFITGYSFKGKAEFAISSDIKLPGAGVAPTKKLEFQGIYFYTPDVNETTANYGGKYIFNVNPGSADLISFDNCQFQYFRGIARLQGSGSVIGKMVINNSVINRIGGYAVMNVDNAGATLKNMELTNSTVSYADKVLINSKATTTEKVTVNNCTFCYVSGGTNYMMDFNGQKPVIQFKNSIVGPSTTGAGASYFRAGSVPTVENVYATGDYVVATNAETGAEVGPIPDIIKYSATSQTLFANPLKLDFTIVDTKFPGKATTGDPRWR